MQDDTYKYVESTVKNQSARRFECAERDWLRTNTRNRGCERVRVKVRIMVVVVEGVNERASFGHC